MRQGESKAEEQELTEIQSEPENNNYNVSYFKLNIQFPNMNVIPLEKSIMEMRSL